MNLMRSYRKCNGAYEVVWWVGSVLLRSGSDRGVFMWSGRARIGAYEV